LPHYSSDTLAWTWLAADNSNSGFLKLLEIILLSHALHDSLYWDNRVTPEMWIERLFGQLPPTSGCFSGWLPVHWGCPRAQFLDHNCFFLSYMKLSELSNFADYVTLYTELNQVVTVIFCKI